MSTLAMLGLLASATTAHGFSVRLAASGDIVRWAEPLVTFYLQYAGSDDLTPEESQLGVRRAIASWEEVTCSPLRFEELGDAPDPSTSLLANQDANGINEIHWIEDDTWTLGAYTLGVTLPLHDGDTGHITEADIAFNGYLVKWRLDSGGGTSLESVAVHELGHMFGMQHNLGPYDFSQPPTMAPSINNQGKSATLEHDDRLGICFMYPVETPYSCADDSECPKVIGRDINDVEYVAGAFPCTADAEDPTGPKTCAAYSPSAAGTVNLGEACLFPDACAAGTLCTPWPDAGTDVCATICAVGVEGECLDGFVCTPYDIQPSTGACLPDGGAPFEPGGGPLGCVNAASCGDGKLCLATPREDDGEVRRCVASCGADNPCADGVDCFFFAGDTSVGACFEAADIAPPVLEPEPEPQVETAPEPGDAFEIADDLAGEETEDPPATVDEGCRGGHPGPHAPWLVVAALVALSFRRRG